MQRIPWMTSASAPPIHRAINSFVFFMFVSDVSKRINNEWAALTGHIFHLAEMALMQSPYITLPITMKLRCCMGKRMLKLNSRSAEHVDDLVLNKTPALFTCCVLGRHSLMIGWINAKEHDANLIWEKHPENGTTFAAFFTYNVS